MESLEVDTVHNVNSVSVEKDKCKTDKGIESNDLVEKKDVLLDNVHKDKQSEENVSENNEHVNCEVDANPRPSLFRRIVSEPWHNIQNIANAAFIQDDNPLYDCGSVGIFSGVYVSYLQNISLLNLIFLRLPWIVGILSLRFMGVVVSLVFGTVLLSFFAVFAIVTNGSDRLYGGPFTTIAYSLGNQVAIIACAMFCLANCAFTGLNLTACTHLIQRYVIQHNSIQPNLPKLALENNRDAIDELCDRSYSMHFILFIAFLTFITILNCFEKGIIKWLCWIPFVVFITLLAGTIIVFALKKRDKHVDVRCLYQDHGQHGYDQLPVLLYLPSKHMEVPSVRAGKIQLPMMKHFCKYPNENVNCSENDAVNCSSVKFRLQAFEWNFKMIRSNLHDHISDSKNIYDVDWRDIIYDLNFFKSVFFKTDIKVTSIIGSALFLLPLFTGSVCGINIPSTLKSPTKNIPIGILCSLCTMLFLISLLSVLLALGVERHFLLDKFGFGTYPVVPIIFSAVHPVIFVSGLVLMSIIAATQSMYTAKSLLLNIITSHLIPVPRFFHRRDSRRRKLITVGIVSLSTLPYLFINNVDYLLLIASCCMLAALIVINLSTTFCSALNFPSFHPGFRLFHSFIAIFGVASCTLLLFGCKLQIGVMVAIIVTIIYSAIAMRSKSLHPWMQHSVVIDIANMLLYSSTQKSAVRLIETFRSKPRCIVFMRFPAASDNLLQMAKILSQNRSALCISLIRDVGDHENTGYDDVYTARQCMNYIKLSGYATQFKYQKISSLHSIASALVSCCGLGVFKSNTVIIEYPAEAALKGRPDSLLYHYHVHRVCVQHCNLVVVKGFFPLKIEALQSNQTIDIWWIIDNGDVLLMVAKMLRKHKMWLQAKLRLFVVVDLKDDIEQIERELYLWLTDNHYLLDKIEFIRADSWIITEFIQLRSTQIKQRYYTAQRKSWFTYLQQMAGVPDGKPIQNAVDNGFRKSQMNSNLEEGERSLRPRELKIRAQQLNREIWQRSSEAALVLMNMPEPPKNLERFWKYLNFLNELSHKLKKVLFVRGVDITFSAESDTSTIRDWTD